MVYVQYFKEVASGRAKPSPTGFGSETTVTHLIPGTQSILRYVCILSGFQDLKDYEPAVSLCFGVFGVHPWCRDSCNAMKDLDGLGIWVLQLIRRSRCPFPFCTCGYVSFSQAANSSEPGSPL